MRTVIFAITAAIAISVAPSLAQQTRTFEECVKLAEIRGFTGADRDMGNPDSAIRQFILRCMKGEQN
jgi:hypothetical protein